MGPVLPGCEAGAVEQGPLVHRLGVEVIPIVAGGQMGVALRIPGRGVDTVQDPGQSVAAAGEDALKPFRELRSRADLLGVAGAHRGHRVGIHDRRLEIVHLPPELQRVTGSPSVPVDADSIQHGGVVDALIAQVVNGEHARGAIEERRAEGMALENRRDEPGLKIVNVQEIGAQIHAQQEFERPSRVERVAIGAVRVVLPRVRIHIDAVATAERRIVEQEEPGPQIGQAQAAEALSATPAGVGEVHLAAGCVLEGDPAQHRAIRGQDHGNVVAALDERFGEGVDDVPQPPDLDEGRHLHGRHHHPERFHRLQTTGAASRRRTAASSGGTTLMWNPEPHSKPAAWTILGMISMCQ